MGIPRTGKSASVTGLVEFHFTGDRYPSLGNLTVRNAPALGVTPHSARVMPVRVPGNAQVVRWTGPLVRRMPSCAGR